MVTVVFANGKELQASYAEERYEAGQIFFSIDIYGEPHNIDVENTVNEVLTEEALQIIEIVDSNGFSRTFAGYTEIAFVFARVGEAANYSRVVLKKKVTE